MSLVPRQVLLTAKPSSAGARKPEVCAVCCTDACLAMLTVMSIEAGPRFETSGTHCAVKAATGLIRVSLGCQVSWLCWLLKSS